MSLLENKWKRYEGEFAFGKRNGLGSIFLTNGEKFIGKFKDNIIEGEGTFYCKSGKTIVARWNDNILVKNL